MKMKGEMKGGYSWFLYGYDALLMKPLQAIAVSMREACPKAAFGLTFAKTNTSMTHHDSSEYWMKRVNCTADLPWYMPHCSDCYEITKCL